MVLRVGVGVAAGQRLLAAEVGEHVEHRVGIGAGGGEEAEAHLVGGRLFSPAVGEGAPLRGLAGGRADGDRGLGRAADDGGRGAEHADRGDALGAREGLVAAALVAAGEMADLVGEDGPHLVERVELGQEAGVDEDVLAAGDEGVRLAILDDVDVDRAPG